MNLDKIGINAALQQGRACLIDVNNFRKGSYANPYATYPFQTNRLIEHMLACQAWQFLLLDFPRPLRFGMILAWR